jgi:hypothetical protein
LLKVAIGIEVTGEEEHALAKMISSKNLRRGGARGGVGGIANSVEGDGNTAQR